MEIIHYVIELLSVQIVLECITRSSAHDFTNKAKIRNILYSLLVLLSKFPCVYRTFDSKICMAVSLMLFPFYRGSENCSKLERGSQ